MKLYWITKLWLKWQIVIPQEARKDLSIKPGDKVVIFSPTGKGIIIAPAHEIKKHLKQFTQMFELD
jgi:AbrB family looped-hinge helix DNA binding protein